MAAADKNKDGKISYQEFYDMVGCAGLGGAGAGTPAPARIRRNCAARSQVRLLFPPLRRSCASSPATERPAAAEGRPGRRAGLPREELACLAGRCTRLPTACCGTK